MAAKTVTATPVNPKVITVKGRLSFPNFSYAEAVARNAKSQFPKKDTADVTPDFNLLLEEPQTELFVRHVLDHYLPFVVQRKAQGETRDALTQAEADQIAKLIEAEAWDSQPPYIPIKPVSDKTQLLAPEAVVSLKVVGNKGMDIEEKALVRGDDELVVPGDVLTFPQILPIGQTTHQLYGGCMAMATLNLYSFVSGKFPGFSASASVCVFRADGDRFGGGVAVDEEAMFLDD